MKPVYRHTVFTIEGEPPHQPFWIVTAYNPRGEIHTRDRNLAADHQLLVFLKKRGESPSRITGLDPDGSHAEPGWSISSDCLAHEAAVLFHQEAYYRVERGILHLIVTDTGRGETIGDWTDRIRIP